MCLTVCSCAKLLSVLNNFLTFLCVRVAELVDPSDANYTKEVLLSQLPYVKGTTCLSRPCSDLTRGLVGGVVVIPEGRILLWLSFMSCRVLS